MDRSNQLLGSLKKYRDLPQHITADILRGENDFKELTNKKWLFALLFASL